MLLSFPVSLGSLQIFTGAVYHLPGDTTGLRTSDLTLSNQDFKGENKTVFYTDVPSTEYRVLRLQTEKLTGPCLKLRGSGSF